jgi:hypothetical protein
LAINHGVDWIMNSATKTRKRFDDLPAAQQAGMLCNEDQFRRFADSRTIESGSAATVGAAAEFIRLFCGVNSRIALNTNAIAAEKFAIMRTEFDAWAGRIQAPR